MTPGPEKTQPTGQGAASRAVAVGLTGGLGAGKTTALFMFRELGAVTLSADAIVHSLYLAPEIRAALVERFSRAILDDNGEVDRRRLRQAVKGDRPALQWLERLTHPRVGAAIERAIREAPSGAVVVCEVPLLFEAGLRDRFQLVVTVEASPGVRLARSADRFDEQGFSEFDSFQAGTERRVQGSDMVFYNDGGLENMRAFVREAYARALALAGADK